MDQIKDTFSSAGFIWDVFIPCNPDTGYIPSLSEVSLFVDEISFFSHHTTFLLFADCLKVLHFSNSQANRTLKEYVFYS